MEVKHYGHAKKIIHRLHSAFSNFVLPAARWILSCHSALLRLVFDELVLPIVWSVTVLDRVYAYIISFALSLLCVCMLAGYGIIGMIAGLGLGWTWVNIIFARDDIRKWVIRKHTGGRTDDRRFDRMEQLLKELSKTKPL